MNSSYMSLSIFFYQFCIGMDYLAATQTGYLPHLYPACPQGPYHC